MGAIRDKVSKVTDFLKKVKMELQKVNWPNREELTSYTAVVLITVTTLIIFIGVVDALFTQIITPLIM
ncbi:MAG: preprotein translocase subunit SecE [Halanaerobiaceae bacterium]